MVDPVSHVGFWRTDMVFKPWRHKQQILRICNSFNSNYLSIPFIIDSLLKIMCVTLQICNLLV